MEQSIPEKKYEYDDIHYANYDFSLCKEKEEFLKLLNNSTPKSVTKFNSKGTKWDLANDNHLDIYEFFVNGGKIYISTCMGSIENFLEFLKYLA